MHKDADTLSRISLFLDKSQDVVSTTLSGLMTIQNGEAVCIDYIMKESGATKTMNFDFYFNDLRKTSC